MNETAHDDKDARFFETLIILDDRSRITDANLYAELPLSWHVVVCVFQDVDSILVRGAYRYLHTVSATAVVAAMNSVNRRPLPFTIEGHVVVFCVPDSLWWECTRALMGVRQLAKRSFQLDLQVASVRMQELARDGASLMVTRYRSAAKVCEVAFLGGGINHTLRLLNARDSRVFFPKEPEVRVDLDLQGLECRWRDLRPRGEETICLVVVPRAERNDDVALALADVTRAIREIYGSDEEHHPLVESNLKLALGRKVLRREAEIKTSGRGRLAFELHLNLLRVLVLIGMMLMRFRVPTKGVYWGGYKQAVIANTNSTNIVHSLRQIVSGSRQQRVRLERYLQSEEEKGHLWFGMHTSSVLHMSCMVFHHGEEHQHFLDGADGGFFQAERDLERRAGA